MSGRCMALKKLKQSILACLLAGCAVSASALEPVSAGTDFARFANAQWEADTVIPEGADRWSARAQLRDDNLKKMAALLAQAQQQRWARQLAAYHASQLDRARLEKKGMAPIQPMLREIAGLK